MKKCPYCKKILNKEEEKIGYCCDINEIKNNIKNCCVVCGRELDNTLEKFLERGNYCPPCFSKRY